MSLQSLRRQTTPPGVCSKRVPLPLRACVGACCAVLCCCPIILYNKNKKPYMPKKGVQKLKG